MRLLFLNPNTSDEMAALMATQARRTASPGTVIDVRSAPFGSSYISTRTEAAVAGHALLQALVDAYDGHDAIVVGAFIIPAVSAAAREASPVPLVATGEAGLAVASVLGQRLTILAIGARERKMTQEVVEASGLGQRLAGIRYLPMGGGELTRRQEDADTLAIDQCRAAVEEDLADVVVLGAGSLEGMAARIQPLVPVPVVSPVSAAVGLAEMIVRLGLPKASAGVAASPGRGVSAGLEGALPGFGRLYGG